MMFVMRGEADQSLCPLPASPQPLWLQNSVRFGELEDVEFYSPDPKMIFSGLCICTSKVGQFPSIPTDG